MVVFNKNDYKILEMLILEDCYSAMCSLSKQAIMEGTKYSHVKVQQVLKSFMLSGLVKEGAKDGNRKTYYYTSEGKTHFMEVFNYDIEELEEAVDNHQNKTNGGKSC